MSYCKWQGKSAVRSDMCSESEDAGDHVNALGLYITALHYCAQDKQLYFKIATMGYMLGMLQL